MSIALRKVYPGLNLDQAKDQVREHLTRAVRGPDGTGRQRDFLAKLNQRLTASGYKPVTRQLLYWWQSDGTFVDAIYWPFIEEITDLYVTRRHLRPDIYGIGGFV